MNKKRSWQNGYRQCSCRIGSRYENGRHKKSKDTICKQRSKWKSKRFDLTCQIFLRKAPSINILCESLFLATPSRRCFGEVVQEVRLFSHWYRFEVNQSAWHLSARACMHLWHIWWRVDGDEPSNGVPLLGEVVLERLQVRQCGRKRIPRGITANNGFLKCIFMVSIIFECILMIMQYKPKQCKGTLSA